MEQPKLVSIRLTQMKRRKVHFCLSVCLSVCVFSISVCMVGHYYLLSICFAVVTPRVQKTSSKPAMPTPPPTPTEATMEMRSYGEADSMDNFIINRCQCSAPKKAVSTGHVMKGKKMLQWAANKKGQKRVSDFFYNDYLPDLITSKKEPPECIVLSSDSDDKENSGPVHVSSPSLDTQVFNDHPNLSPIRSDDECIIIGDSSNSSSQYCNCRL